MTSKQGDICTPAGMSMKLVDGMRKDCGTALRDKNVQHVYSMKPK